MVLRPDDSATYERGKDLPERRGTIQRGRMEKGTFARLSRLLDEGGLSQWGDKYEIAAFHRTKYLLTIQRGKSERVIDDYGQAGPPSLWAFELVVERLIDTTAWK